MHNQQFRHSKSFSLRDTQQHNTRHATQNAVTLNQYKTAFDGTHSIKHQSALIWNQINNEPPSDLLQKSRSQKINQSAIIKIILTTLIS